MLMPEKEPELVERRRRHAELFERRHAFPVIEKTKHDLLAEDGPQRGHAQVDFVSLFSRDMDAAVLRQSFFGNVETGHDFDARDQAVVNPLRHIGDLFQQPVETVANDHVVFGRLDVDVTGPALEGALHHQIDDINDRRVVACRTSAVLNARTFVLRRRAVRTRGLAGAGRRGEYASVRLRCGAHRNDSVVE